MSKTKVKTQNKEKAAKKSKKTEDRRLDTNQSGNEFSTDWDVEKYRREYESEEHWQLRKRFMELHKDKFPEDKIVCLAQVFTNMEFMGCKYPSETMRMVAELSKEVAKEFRAERANRLKRTFVTASDAAEARAKGRGSAQTTNSENSLNNKRKGFGMDVDESQSKKSLSSIDLFSDLKFGKLILFLHTDRNCIRSSVERCKMQFTEKEILGDDDRKQVELYVNDQLVASACEDNLKNSKMQAINKAMSFLQEHCYAIKQNPLRDTVKIEKSNNKVKCNVVKSEEGTEQKLDSNNKGYKMMKMMGWTGGGLGSKKQGREDPVGYLLKNNRAGLGNEACRFDRKYFRQLLKNYVESDDIRELQFEPTFTKEERAMLHEIAHTFHLKSHSYGKDEMRRLVISKKNIGEVQILEEVLINKNPRFIDRFLVRVPKLKFGLFPDHTVELTL